MFCKKFEGKKLPSQSDLRHLGLCLLACLFGGFLVLFCFVSFLPGWRETVKAEFGWGLSKHKKLLHAHRWVGAGGTWVRARPLHEDGARLLPPRPAWWRSQPCGTGAAPWGRQRWRGCCAGAGPQGCCQAPGMGLRPTASPQPDRRFPSAGSPPALGFLCFPHGEAASCVNRTFVRTATKLPCHSEQCK